MSWKRAEPFERFPNQPAISRSLATGMVRSICLFTSPGGLMKKFLISVLLGSLVLLSTLLSQQKDTEIQMPPTGNPASIYVAPNGQMFSFAAPSADRRPQIWIQALADRKLQEPSPLEGTETGVGGCWSPDSQWLAFTQGARLKKINVLTREINDLGPYGGAMGCTWNPDGTILFGFPNQNVILSISEKGGSAAPVTPPGDLQLQS